MIEVNCFDNNWHNFFSEVEFFVDEVIKLVLFHEGEGYENVSVILANSKFMCELNNKYAGYDKATNVLAFPSSGELGNDFLGDIAIGLGIIIEEAAFYKVSVERYTAHMLIHASLHLLGFDHQNDSEATIMEEREREIMERLGYCSAFIPS